MILPEMWFHGSQRDRVANRHTQEQQEFGGVIVIASINQNLAALVAYAIELVGHLS
jgi:hypothetical protein